MCKPNKKIIRCVLKLKLSQICMRVPWYKNAVDDKSSLGEHTYLKLKMLNR